MSSRWRHCTVDNWAGSHQKESACQRPTAWLQKESGSMILMHRATLRSGDRGIASDLLLELFTLGQLDWYLTICLILEVAYCASTQSRPSALTVHDPFSNDCWWLIMHVTCSVSSSSSCTCTPLQHKHVSKDLSLQQTSLHRLKETTMDSNKVTQQRQEKPKTMHRTRDLFILWVSIICID